MRAEIRADLADEVIRLIREYGGVRAVDWQPLHDKLDGMNSYERQFVIPYMRNDLLANQIEFTIKNCGRVQNPPATYEEAIQYYAAEAAKRLRPGPSNIKEDEVLGEY